MMRRAWRGVARLSGVLLALRVGLAVAKVIAGASTVETALTIVGLGEYVDMVDDAVWSVVMRAYDALVGPE